MSTETRHLPPIRPDAPLPKEYWPDVEHLVTEDDTPVDNIYHEKQQRLLTEPLYTSWNPGMPFVVMANVGLFYKVGVPPLVPDTLYAQGVSLPPGDLLEKGNRSYYMWVYGRPDAVIEIVSNSDGDEDTRKLELYASLGVLYYAIWDPGKFLNEQPLRLLTLSEGVYVPLEGHLLKRINLGLKVWHGAYEGFEVDWLRWCDAAGNVIPTGAEATQAAQRKAESAQQRAERLAAKLRELGVEPNGE